MLISIIVAVSENGIIGIKGGLPWHLSEDLKNFKKLTSGHAIIMGRKTYESIGKPLPNRKNIIISRNKAFKADGCFIFDSVSEAIKHAGETAEDESFIIGGGEVYRQSLELADKVYLTKVKVSLEGDTFFPELEKNSWKILSVQSFKKDNKNEYDFDIIEYQRIK